MPSLEQRSQQTLSEVSVALNYALLQTSALPADAMDLVWQSTSEKILQLSAPPLPHRLALEVIRLVTAEAVGAQMPRDVQTRIINRVNEFVINTASATTDQSQRTQMQSCVGFENYISKKAWSVLLTHGLSLSTALQTLRDSATAVGLFYPNEPTFVSMTAILLASRGIPLASMTPEDSLTMLRGVKDIVRSQRAMGKLMFKETEPMFYPPSMDDFKRSHPAVYAYAYPEEGNPPNCCPLSRPDLQQLKAALPARSSKRLAPPLALASAAMQQRRGDELLTNLQIFPPKQCPVPFRDQASQQAMRSAQQQLMAIGWQPPASGPVGETQPSPAEPSTPDKGGAGVASDATGESSPTSKMTPKKRPAAASGSPPTKKLPFPGKPKSKTVYAPLIMGDWRIYTDFKKNAWRACYKKHGKRQDISASWACDAEAAWKQLMSSLVQ